MNNEYNTLITGASGLLGSQISLTNSLKPSSKALNLLEYEQLNDSIIVNTDWFPKVCNKKLILRKEEYKVIQIQN